MPTRRSNTCTFYPSIIGFPSHDRCSYTKRLQERFIGLREDESFVKGYQFHRRRPTHSASVTLTENDGQNPTSSSSHIAARTLEESAKASSIASRKLCNSCLALRILVFDMADNLYPPSRHLLVSIRSMALKIG